MALTEDMQAWLANDARAQQLRARIANLQGKADATASAIQKLNSINNDTAILLLEAQAQLAAIQTGAGAGITADFGPKSIVGQLLELERFAAKDAVIDYVKANPACSEDDANAVWHDAAIASHPSFGLVLQDGLVMAKLYRANLLKVGLIAEDSWEAHRAFILATDKTVIETL